MKISDALLSMQWAILEDYLVRMDACDQDVPTAEVDGAGGQAAVGYTVQGGIASIPLKGVILQERTMLTSFLTAIFGGTILGNFVAALQAADADPTVGGIVIDVNSPGGEALGIESAARVIANVQKPVTAYVDGMAASAAYWLASAADQIVLSGETSQAGSIGTVLGLRDTREADQKAGVKRHEVVSSQSPKKRPDPATDEGYAVLQGYVDQLAAVFLGDVASNRGTAVETVQAEFGQGAMVMGSDAVKRGMADGVMSRDAMLTGMRAGQYELGGSAARLSSKGAVRAMKTPEELASEQKAAAEKTHAEAVEAAKAAGIGEGRKLERARIAAILGCPEAKQRGTLALSIASETDMDAETAKKMLAAAAVEATATVDPLKAAMANVPNPPVGTGGTGGELDEAAEVAAIVAAGKLARGGK